MRLRPGLFLSSCEASALAGALALLLAMVVVLVDIATRRSVGSPITGLNDLIQLAVVACSCLAMPLAFARRAHVEVSFVTNRLPQFARRGLARIVAIAEAGLLALLFVHGWQQALLRQSFGDASPTLGLPVVIYWGPYLLGIGLSALAALGPLLRPDATEPAERDGEVEAS